MNDYDFKLNMKVDIYNLNEQQAAMINRAEEFYSKCTEIKNHPLLNKNNIKICDGRQDANGRYVVPMVIQDVFITVVSISADGRYDFFENWIPDGAYYRIEGDSSRDGFMICEDYMAGQKLNKLTGTTVLCAMTLCNILNVAEEIRLNIRPHAPIAIVIDSLIDFPFNERMKQLCCSVFSRDMSSIYPDCVKFPTRLGRAIFNINDYYKAIEEYLVKPSKDH